MQDFKPKFNPIEGNLIIPTSLHTWHYCTQCRDWIVICGICGNNCCNGGSGKTTGTTNCNCDEAYSIQFQWFDSPEYLMWLETPEYKKRYDEAQLRNEKFWKSLSDV